MRVAGKKPQVVNRSLKDLTVMPDNAPLVGHQVPLYDQKLGSLPRSRNKEGNDNPLGPDIRHLHMFNQSSNVWAMVILWATSIHAVRSFP